MRNKCWIVGLIVFLFVGMLGITNVHAEITSGNFEGMDWKIDTETGVLTLGKTGETQTLSDRYTRTYGGWPWYSSRSSITSVVTEGDLVMQGSFSGMFYGCSNLTSVDLSRWNTSAVIYMDRMFDYCSRLRSLDLSDWDVSMVSDVREMFSGCSGLNSLNLSGWDVSKITSMERMFYRCTGLTSLDVSGWNPSKVTTMAKMFEECSQLTDLDLSGWNTSKLVNMSDIFYQCSNLTSLNLSGWDTSNVTTMKSAFYKCSNLTSLNLFGWDTSKVTNMGWMFGSCSSLASIDLSSWNTANVKDMGLMFLGCSALTSLDLSRWNTSNVTDIRSMFDNCSELVLLDVSGWDTSNVMSMYSMFCNCSKLTTLDVSGWDTSKVTSMEQMFKGCSRLTSLDVSKWNTSNVANMKEMFRACVCLEALDVSGWDTSSVTDMEYMFWNCQTIPSLDISGWNTSKVKNMYELFFACETIQELDLSGWDTSNVTSIGSAYNMRNLSRLILGVNNPFIRVGSPTSTLTKIPSVKDGISYTGKWIREDGTYGPYETEELRDNYTSAMAGVWVWEHKLPQYTIRFKSSEKTAIGSMPIATVSVSDEYVIPESSFQVYHAVLAYWKDEQRDLMYVPGDVIPANTYSKDNAITLTAYFEIKDTFVDMHDGTFDFSIKADEKAYFTPIPSSTAYQVYEQSPNGWNLIAQSNTAGTITSLTESESIFLNQYDPFRATVRLMGTKLMDGSPAQEGAFSFLLYEGDTLVDIATVKDGGLIEFQPITYDRSGEHQYMIREAIVDDNEVTYDTHVEQVTVSITSDGAGNLTANVTMDDDEILFENESKPGNLTLYKLNSAENNSEGTFLYELQLLTANGQPYDLPETEITFENRAGITVDYPDLEVHERTKYILTKRSIAINEAGQEMISDSREEHYAGDIYQVIDTVRPGWYLDTMEASDLIQTSSDTWKGVMSRSDVDVIMTYRPLLSLTGSIVWDDAAFGTDRRPDMVMVNLVMDDEVVASQDVSSPWKFTFNDVRGYQNGTPVTYEVRMDDVTGYEISVNSHVITATRRPMTATIDKTKWIANVNNNNSSSSEPLRSATSFVRTSSYSSVETLPDTAVKIDDGSTDYSIYFWKNGDTAYWWTDAEIVYAPADSSYMFYTASKLTELDVSDWDTSNVTNMASMFANCYALTSLDLTAFDTSNVTNMNNMFGSLDYMNSNLASIDLSSFDTSSVTNMSGMFSGCNSLTSIDVNHFDTSNVTNMGSMFSGCRNIESLDLNSFDTSNVTNMSAMFSGCYKLSDLNIDSFDTSNVADMSAMFSACRGFTSLDLSHFDTSNVMNMRTMFYGCNSLTELNISSFNTSNVTNMSSMFGGYNVNTSSRAINKLTNLDLSNFDTSSVTDMSSMFTGCLNIKSLDLSNFDTSNVTNMNSMFYGCNSLESVDLSSFNTSKVTQMNSMFGGVNSSYEYSMNSLKSLDLSSFDTSNVTSMYGMFKGCRLLFSLNLSNFNTSNVTNMSEMFGGMCGIQNLDLSSFDTSKVTNMSEMFGGSPGSYSGNGIRTLNLSSFDTSNVTNMRGMFEGCSYVKVLDISSFDTSKVTNMSGMFGNSGSAYGCYNLETVYVSDKWDTSSVTSDSNMFYNYMHIVGGNGTEWNSSNSRDKTYACVDTDEIPGYFTYKVAP